MKKSVRTVLSSGLGVLGLLLISAASLESGLSPEATNLLTALQKFVVSLAKKNAPPEATALTVADPRLSKSSSLFTTTPVDLIQPQLNPFRVQPYVPFTVLIC